MKIYNGYLAYRFYNIYGNYTCFWAHRLVKMIFDPMPHPEKYTVDHINMNKEDNSIYNLDWVSQQENNKRKNNIIYNNDNYKNYNSIFNNDDLVIIFKLLKAGKSYSEILKSIGKDPNSKTLRDYIGNIKRGVTYVHDMSRIEKELMKDDK